MAKFPVKLGQRNGGNARVLRGLTTGVFKDSFTGNWWWVVNLKRGMPGLTLEGDGSQVITLNTLFSGNPFPTNVIRKQALVYVEDAIVGPSISAGTVILGDNGNPDGLIESQSTFTSDVTLQSVAAAEFAPRFEAAFSPETTITATGAALNVATSLSYWYMIEFSPVASVT